MNHEVITVSEFCARWRISRDTFMRMTDKPPFTRIGRVIRMTLRDVEEWEQRRKTKDNPQYAPALLAQFLDRQD